MIDEKLWIKQMSYAVALAKEESLFPIATTPLAVYIYRPL